MHNSRLLTYLTSLTKSELKSFHLFLQSPYFNQNQNLVELFQYLQKYHPKFSPRKVEKQRVFETVFPEKAYNEGKMNILMSAMNKCLETFFSIENCKNSAFEMKKNKVIFLKNKSLTNAFSRHLRNLKTELTKQEKEGKDRLFEQMVIAKENAFYSSAQDNRKTISKKIDTFRYNLDLFYLKERLRLTCLDNNAQEIFGTEIDASLQNALIEEFSDEINQNPVLIFYKQFLTLENDQNLKLLAKMGSDFLESFDKFLPLEQKTLMVILLNKIFQTFDPSRSALFSLAMQLYDRGLTERLFEENGYLPEVTFINIATIAIVTNQLEWGENFINQYSRRLPEKLQKDAQYLAFGMLDFKKSQLAKRNKQNKEVKTLLKTSIKNLEQLDPNKPLYAVKVRSLLLRVYYEDFTDLDKLENHIAAFEIKMKRAKLKLNKVKIQAYRKLIHVVRRLTALRSDIEITKKSINDLIEYVEKHENIAQKDWLKEKIDEIKKERNI